MHLSGSGRVYSDYRDLDPHASALVLGTSHLSAGGEPNPYFLGRIQAAHDLIRSGTVERLIVSGDNEHRSYNEPVQMRLALRASGVPENQMVLDFAGFRTLDSVVRVYEVFGQKRVVIVSQEFHNRRALFIARHHGVDAVGYNAPYDGRKPDFWMVAREAVARVLAVFDVLVFDTQPRFLGEPVLPDPAQTHSESSMRLDGRAAR